LSGAGREFQIWVRGGEKVQVLLLYYFPMLFLSRLLQICCSGGAGVLGSGGGCVFEGFLLAEFGIVLVGSCFGGCCVVAVSGGCVAGDSGGDGDYSGSGMVLLGGLGVRGFGSRRLVLLVSVLVRQMVLVRCLVRNFRTFVCLGLRWIIWCCPQVPERVRCVDTPC
jgi:hypothetical protein